ncbi:calcium-binding protein [Streptomyces sp. NPDC049813]|uniref:calcium-binding protein n=1 Tax=Streptomyces sp. NPDC049813 TaxID=3365597 RepID=UPI00379E0F2D
MRSHPIGHRSLTGAAAAAALVLAAAPVLLAGTATAAAPAAATAALDPSGHFAVYTAAPGQVNDAVVTATKADGSADISYVIDDVVPIDAGDGCTYPDATDRTAVTCTVTTLDSQDPYATLQLGLGDQDDTVRYANATGQTYNFAAIDLGDGADALTDTGDEDGNSVRGGAGDDTIEVGAAAVVLGDDGADTVRATGGGAVVQGGIGDDTIDADGDSSSVSGGAGDDLIRGGAYDQNLSGDDGDDEIHGGPGNDWLYGGKGADLLYGDGGDDTLYGNSGNDTLYGGPGTDTLSGGPGTNTVHQN